MASLECRLSYPLKASHCPMKTPSLLRTRTLLLPSLRRTVSSLAIVALFLIGFARFANADINTINQKVWQAKFGVTDAQLYLNADPAQGFNTTWLNADDDGDGIKNGAELAAGTNPFSTSSTIKVSSISLSGGNVTLQFPTENGKRYRAQSTTTLSNPASWSFPVQTPTEMIGDGASKSIVLTYVGSSFYRIFVDDKDSDNDGASDWAEKISGYNPNSAMTDGRTPDGTALGAALSSLSQVTVTATKANATQPPDALTAPVEIGSVTVSRSIVKLGSLIAPNISVPLLRSGTAIEGTDYDSLSAFSTLVFPAGSNQVVFSINPKANASRKTNVTAIIKALPGAGYRLGSASSASVVINPAGIASGTGLTGNYQNTSSSTYATQQTIFAGPAEMSRTDATIDFASGVNGWGAVGGPTGLTTASTNGAFSVRWTGQILPQYSETYSIDVRSDDSAKVWVNGVLLIDRWAAQGVTDYTNTINLTAGVLYDIQIDYWNTATGGAEAHLYWWSGSQVRQIIPQNRLFPAPTQLQKLTAITNLLNAVGYTGIPFSFNVTVPDISGTVTYALDASSGPLPPGLTLTSATGAITGTPTVAGTYNVAINATNTAAAAVTGSSVVNFTIYPTGGVSREVLGVASGPNVSDITLPSGTPAHDTIATLDEDVDYAANMGERLRGYLVPPKTGNYYFWIAANNNAELWISNDAESVNKVRRASVIASSGKYVWNNALVTQQSPWLALVAGQKYYFEVLHNKGPVGDHFVEVGWCQDDIGTVPSVAGAPNTLGARTVIPNGGGALQGYALSGTVPGYIFQPYDYPTTVVVSGDLYGGNLGPQGSSTSKASGSATIRTNALGNGATSAILHFNYGNLSAPKTSYHLHTDAFATHPAGEIVFDIDDIDQNHPELLTADGGYIWNFSPGGTFLSVQQIRDAITQGKIYLNVHTVNYPNGEIRGNLTLINGSQTPPDASLYPEPATTDLATNPAHAARFLNQTSFGASPADVTYVMGNGFNGWIDAQLTKPASRVSNEVVANISSDINQPYPSALFTNAWWKYSITGQDQLRQRLAFALSEILVVSWANDSGPLAANGRILADYYDNLVDYCLPTSGLADSGTFRGILKSVTLTPAMGLYLDMRGNQKGDDTLGRHPNENYAREIMQLFSVGINRVWDDGKFVLNANADVVATYTQPSILGVAALLTGWNYAQATQSNGRLGTSTGPGADYLNAMTLVSSQHDRNKKLLLNNIVTPAATGLTPRVSISSIGVGNPCTVTASTVHGLQKDDTVMIAGVTGGLFGGAAPSSANINTSQKVVAVTSPTTFTVAVSCTSAAGAAGTVTGATVIPAAFAGTTAGITAITGSQTDSSNFTGWTLPHPYDQYGLAELDTVIDNIVTNDNVPPYICRQLIQRLVTSNPSPGYVFRVVQKFKNNGAGVRGDMIAVVRQILTDGEARSWSATSVNNTFGKQREPMLRLTGAARAFPATPYTGTYTQLTGINANKLRIVTSAPNSISAGFTLALNFQGNYTSTVPPVPYTNPTSTTYGVASTLGIASTYTDITSITPGAGASTTIVTAQPHGLTSGNTVTLSGVSGITSPAITTTGFVATVSDATTFTIPVTTAFAFQITDISVNSPCTVTTANAHGLTVPTAITINGIVGGIYTYNVTAGGTASFSINATVTATPTGTNTFTITRTTGEAINCTLAPTSITTFRHVSNPCRVTTVVPHGLSTGTAITIGGVSGGAFSPSISNTYSVTVIDPTSFTIPVNCTAPSTNNTGTLIGGNTLDVNATGMINVTYSQVAGSNLMTINTGGPQTDIVIPVPNSATTTLKSRVYLNMVTVASSVGIASIAVSTSPCVVTTTQNHGLTNGNIVTFSSVTTGSFSPSINNNSFSVTVTGPNTFTVSSSCTVAPTAGTGSIAGSWISIAANGIYDVQTSPGSTFTVTTTDTPAGPRSGNVIIPKISTSYTPVSSNNVVQYNCNSNHHLLTGDHVWVDAPVVGNPVADGEFVVTAPITGSGILPVDEDHFQTSYLPVSSVLGTYSKPSSSNNGITFWPLQLRSELLMRSGVVTINQSAFNLGTTESSLSQSPLNAPTVFNYFLPYYKYPGSLSNNGIDSPEFQLTTDTNISNLTNNLANMFIGTGGGNGNVNGLSSFSNGNGSIVMDIGDYVNHATKATDAGISGLITELANLLCGVPLETATQTTIQNFVTYRKAITNISQASPCVITAAGHGLVTGNQIAINDTTGGTFTGGSSSINGSWIVTVIDANTFRISTVATTPVAENCTASGTIVYTNANISNFPMNIPNPGPTNLQKRDRVRAILHLILTSAEYAVQK